MNHENLLGILLLVEEEEEEDFLEVLQAAEAHRNEVQQLFLNRPSEGCFKILICNYLIDNDTKFQEYLRLTPYLFNEVHTTIKNDITRKINNRHLKPITSEEKLCLILR